MAAQNQVFVTVPKTLGELPREQGDIVFRHGIADNPYSIKDTVFFAVAVDVANDDINEVAKAKNALDTGFPQQPWDRTAERVQASAQQARKNRTFYMAGTAGAVLIGGGLIYASYEIGDKTPQHKSTSDTCMGIGVTLLEFAVVGFYLARKAHMLFKRNKADTLMAKQNAEKQRMTAYLVIGERLANC